jgi:LacI family transcriptional regulator
MGHRRIACLSNRDPASSVSERLEGYRSALSSAGLPFRADLVFAIRRDDECGVQEALDGLLSLNEPPTAYFAINDHIALQAHEQLNLRGNSIPAEVSVAGFDGLLRWVPGGGHLTSAQQNFERIGQLSMELLLERIEQSPGQASRHILLDAPLAIQGSTGPALIHSVLDKSATTQEVIS